MRASLLAPTPLALALVVAATFAAPASAQFRFLCNGINSDGSSDPDCNEPCNASTAARWEIATVPWTYDTTTRPPEISATRWNNEIAAARNNWNAVMGITLVDGGEASFREFGSDNGENEIFWILSGTEWNNKVGGGVNSALGVTITQNTRCFSSGRDIFDADVVMNGAGFNWGPGDTSSLSTLSHEMGHGIGLGHPCAICDQLMSATSTFDEPDGPQGGDVEGIQQLYPAPGRVGSSCSVDGDCDDNLCANVGGSSFCTESCTTTCPNGMVCFDDVTEGNICIFNSTEVSPPGGACGPPGCADACDFDTVGPGCNFCIEFTDGTGQCFAGCNAQTQAGCGANEACSTIFQGDSVSGVCVPAGTAVRGQPCGGDVGCIDGLVCAVTDGDNGTCIGLCDADTGTGCLATEHCYVAFTDGTAACFPAGTNTEGADCNGNDFTDCVRGAVCLGSVGNQADGTCFQRCDQNFECTSADDDCIALDGVSYCQPPGVIGEGEGEGEGEGGEGEGEPPPPEGECRISRGNFDCPPGDACEVKDGEDIGTCTGEEGDKRTFEVCEDGSDCRTGLCEDGVCTRPCDEGDCPDGYECDEDAAPARDIGGDPGLCLPESCQNDHSICEEGDGFRCVYTGNYVCAKDGDPVGCAHAGGRAAGNGNALAGVIALVGLALLGKKRRPLK
jgi:hypothetical protein